MVDGEKYQVSSDLHMCHGTYIHQQMNPDGSGESKGRMLGMSRKKSIQFSMKELRSHGAAQGNCTFGS